MSDITDWTPLGCGPYRGDDPDFPIDFMPRLKSLDLGIEAVFLAWEITRLAGEITSVKRQRALMLLVLAVQLASAGGGTRLMLSPGGQLDRILEDLSATAEERASVDQLLDQALKLRSGIKSPGLAALFGGPGDYRPLIIDHGCLYIQKLHALETRVGEKLRDRINGEAAALGDEKAAGMLDEAVENALGEVLNSPPVTAFGKFELDIEQKEAVRAALGGRVTIVSGRPGSGKTAIVAIVLRVLSRVGYPPLESIALAAPTGKAADKMRRAIASHLAAIPDPQEADRRLAAACPPSSTLHRLLGYSPGRDLFRHDEYNPLSERFVVVDEGSMVDLTMMDRLLRALPPEARIVFLGDADQLPPVDTGAVFRDLCRSSVAKRKNRVVVLGKSYRAREEDRCGKQILDAAAAVNSGRSPAAGRHGDSLMVKKQLSELHFEGVEYLSVDSEEQLVTFFARWRELLHSSLPDLAIRVSRAYTYGPLGFDKDTGGSLRTVFEHYERFRILCVTRAGAGKTGSEAANSWFHHQWSDELRSLGRAPGNAHFQLGEPVLVTRNDYSLNLFNGDPGLVMMVTHAHETGHQAAEPMAVFSRGGGFVAYPLELLRGKLELAWAATVHKAQGSEYEHVAILLPEAHVRPLTRELLYTAITRAKKSVVFVGNMETLESGVKRKAERASGLVDMLG